jgi:nucleoside-diphosphate-sugar epimerase
MKVFVAGATGAIGRPLVSALAAARHEVVGMTSSDRGLRVLLLWARRSPCIRNGLAGWKCVARSFRERPNIPANRKAGTGFARFGGSCLALRIVLWARNPSRS